MKKVLIYLIVTLFVGLVKLTAQNKQLLYDFYELPQSLLVNPGVKTPHKWHFGVPLLSNINFYAGSSGLTVGDLFLADGVDFNTKFRAAVNNINFRDAIEAGGTFEVFFGGFRGKIQEIIFPLGLMVKVIFLITCPKILWI